MKSVVAALCLASATAHAQSPSEAERLFVAGQDAFDGERYQEAIDAWTRSFALSHEPGLLFNLGQAYRLRGHAGDCTRAQASYQRFVGLEPKSKQRKDAEDLIAELDKCVANETSTLGVATAHDLAMQPVVDPRDTTHEDGRLKKIIGIAAGAGGVVLVIAGMAYGSRASRFSAQVETGCAHGCNWGDFSGIAADGKRAEKTEFVLYGLGVAALATGGIFYYVGERETHRAPVLVTPTRGGAAVSWSHAW